MASKRLAFLRHAKSSWNEPDLDDFDRPLNRRGQRAATRMGQHMKDEGLRPELVLCSAALRTRQTLERLDLPDGVAVCVEPGLYGASATALFDRVRRIEDGIATVLMIGHNPGMHDAVAGILAADEASPPEFPTAALAITQLTVEHWQDVRPGIARLEAFTIPRSLD